MSSIEAPCPFCNGTGKHVRTPPQFRKISGHETLQKLSDAIFQSAPGTQWVMRDFVRLAAVEPGNEHKVYNAVNYLTVRKIISRTGYGKFQTPAREETASVAA